MWETYATLLYGTKTQNTGDVGDESYGCVVYFVILYCFDDSKHGGKVEKREFANDRGAL